MEIEKISKKEERKKRKRRRWRKKALVYYCCCKALLIPLAIFAVLILRAANNENEIMICPDEPGNCTGYAVNQSCNVNSTWHDVQGGTSCWNKCTNDTKNFECKCPKVKIWQSQNLSCLFRCLHGSGNCNDYNAGNYCVPQTDVYSGFNCSTLCENGVMNYTCQCPDDYLWNSEEHRCVMKCSKTNTSACNDSIHIAIPCMADMEVSGGISCKTTCKDGNTTFTCACPVTPKKHWSYRDKECQYECRKVVPQCDSLYPDNKTCILAISSNLKSDCLTRCAKSNGDHICTCLTTHQWNNATYECDLKCPTSIISGCNESNLLNLPCVSSMDVSGATDCKTICHDGNTTFTCACPVEPKKLWSYENRECQYECRKGVTQCDSSYPDNKTCILATSSTLKSNCQTRCAISNGDHICTCPATHKWNNAIYECDLICPTELISGCNDSEFLNLPCVLPMDVSGATACKTNCQNDTKSFECKCPELKIWMAGNFTCSFRCLHGPGNCNDYSSGNYCVPQNDVNNGFNCSTLCKNDKRNFECQCPDNYLWIIEENRCVLKCPDAIVPGCSDSNLINIPCMPSRNDSGGTSCKTTCNDGNTTFYCTCQVQPKKLWSYKYQECHYECQTNVSQCDESYPNNKACTLTYPSALKSDCLTQCSTAPGSHLCICPATHQWNNATLECDLICGTTICLNEGEVTSSQKCYLSDALNGETDCVLNCNGENSNYYCACPLYKIWNTITNKCVQGCWNEVPVCNSSYEHNIPCYLNYSSDTNTDCMTQCTDAPGYYKCSCLGENFEWNNATFECEIPCSNGSCTYEGFESSTCFDPMQPNTYNRGFNCKTICSTCGILNYICECPSNYKWSKNYDCINICRKGVTRCDHLYPDNVPCQLVDSSLTILSCNTSCSQDYGDYICKCFENNYLWDPINSQCKDENNNPSSATGCPSPFKFVANVGCLLLHPQLVNFQEAQLICNLKHPQSHLVMIEDSATNTESLSFFLADVNYASTCRDLTWNQSWVWTAGLSESNYDFYWRPYPDKNSWKKVICPFFLEGEPNGDNSEQLCIQFNSEDTGYWYDCKCIDQRCPLCQIIYP